MSKPYLTATPEQRLANEIADLKTRFAALESRQGRQRTTAVTALTLLNGWGNFGTGYANASYRMVSGLVVLRGMISGGTATVGTVLFNLPSGFRPAARLLFTTTSAGALARIDVLANGDAQIQAGTATWISLDGIMFAPDA